MKTVPLNSGLITVVDDSDYRYVKDISWYANGTKGLFYAYSTGRIFGRSEKQTSMARLLTGAQKGETVDHKNGNTLDNRRCNLRVCSALDNGRNSRRSKSNSTGKKGVTERKRKGKGNPSTWRSTITVNKKSIHLGEFTTLKDAADAYDRAAVNYFGEFARTNAMLDAKPLLSADSGE